jgi:hypothetical protein
MDSSAAIHTPTIEDFVEVVELSLYLGNRWRCGSTSIQENYWVNNGDSTCIIVKNGIITYCNKLYALVGPRYHIINMELFRYDNRKDRLKIFKNKFKLK